jgi:hypothetical protein
LFRDEQWVQTNEKIKQKSENVETLTIDSTLLKTFKKFEVPFGSTSVSQAISSSRYLQCLLQVLTKLEIKSRDCTSMDEKLKIDKGVF